jgi:hypothetical protein
LNLKCLSSTPLYSAYLLMFKDQAPPRTHSWLLLKVLGCIILKAPCYRSVCPTRSRGICGQAICHICLIVWFFGGTAGFELRVLLLRGGCSSLESLC